MALATDAPAHAVLPGDCQLRPLEEAHLDAVHAIERLSQPSPWSRGMFADCLRVGYSGWVLLTQDSSEHAPQLGGFAISSLALDEAHLLNIAVAPLVRRQGLGRLLTEHMLRLAARAEARCMLLEVRASNSPALGLYADLGFEVLARRRAYYPQRDGGREDALVMRCMLDASWRARNLSERVG